MLLVAALLLESLTGWATLQEPPLTIGLAYSTSAGGHPSVTITANSHRPFPLDLHIGALPGTMTTGARTAFLLVDPAYPALFGSYSDVLALQQRVGVLLSEIGSSTTLVGVTAPALAGALNSTPNATLIVAEYGSIPPELLSQNSSLLRGWIENGGTLIWAGGPLGYFEATSGTTSRGCCPAGLGWEGQTELVGFPLTPPANVSGVAREPAGGNPIGIEPSAYGSAFGTTYNGTLFGANVTQLQAHGGISLGFQTPSNGAPIRTSLAYLPLGQGRLYYFGNALWSPTGVYTPEGGLSLSVDIARLLATNYVPELGVPSEGNETMPAEGSGSVTLSLPVAGASSVIVECSTEGVPLWEFASEVPSRAAGTGLNGVGRRPPIR